MAAAGPDLKRKASAPPPPPADSFESFQAADLDLDEVKITPLGGGNEVGRSCHIIQFKGKTIMLDCGIHPAYTGVAGLPFLDSIEAKDIDVILVSHFHLDHIAALPYFMEKTDFKGKVYMTHPTKSIYKLIVQDYVKVSTISVEEQLYTEQDLKNSFDKIEAINYNEVVHYKGIKFWCYNAGHVLGAAMFMLEIAGVKILYTGDYSRTEDRHLRAAETPEQKPDILIVEATYGVQQHRPAAERERRFKEMVHKVVYKNGGKCLIPVFALGRAQELLLILDEFWSERPNLHHIPIFYAGTLAHKCMKVYQRYTNFMNDRIIKQASLENPFRFRHVRNLKAMEYDDAGPAVVMASPGMLQNGLSRELFEQWAPEMRNGCVIPGYCVDGTLAFKLMNEPDEVMGLNGIAVPVRMEVHYISFSAHADFMETKGFIAELKPDYVILVHGDSNQMSRLQQALTRIYADGSIRVFSPQNCQPVCIGIRPQKVVKLVGSLANTEPQQGSRLSGLLVRKDFNYHMVDAADLAQYTPLSTSSVLQRLTVGYQQTYDTLWYFLSQVYELEGLSPDQVKQRGGFKDKPGDEESKGKEKKERIQSAAFLATDPFSVELGPVIVVLGEVFVHVRRQKSSGTAKGSANEEYADHVLLEWKSNPVSDMLADSVIALVMSSQSSPGAARAVGTSHSHGHGPFKVRKVEKKEKTTASNDAGADSSIDDRNESADARRATATNRNVIAALRRFLGKQFDDVHLNEKQLVVGFSDVMGRRHEAQIDARSFEVTSQTNGLKERVNAIVHRVVAAVCPLRPEPLVSGQGLESSKRENLPAETAMDVSPIVDASAPAKDASSSAASSTPAPVITT